MSFIRLSFTRLSAQFLVLIFVTVFFCEGKSQKQIELEFQFSDVLDQDIKPAHQSSGSTATERFTIEVSWPLGRGDSGVILEEEKSVHLSGKLTLPDSFDEHPAFSFPVLVEVNSDELLSTLTRKIHK